MTSYRRILLTVLASVGMLLATAGCTSLRGTGNNQFVSGNGEVQSISAAERGAPVDFAGKDLDGKQLSLQSMRGKPTVVTIWWAGCPPCRQEAPLLVGAHRQLGNAANFVGIDVRDAGTAGPRAFVSQFHIPWPSFYSPGGQGLLAFPGTLTPNTIPATVVLDGHGRVAARIVGAIPSQLTLVEVVRDVVRHG
jgi:thiol-disulfide isomerase/thioredoxin